MKNLFAKHLPSPFGRGVGGEGCVAGMPQDSGLPASALTLTLSQRERGPSCGHALAATGRAVAGGWLALALAVAALCGCDSGRSSRPAAPGQPTANAPAPPERIPAMAAEALETQNEGRGPPRSQQQPATSKAPPAPSAASSNPPPATERRKAEAKDRDYGKSVIASPITRPVASLFAFRENAVLTIQIPYALKLFKGAEGRAPKSHEEFMEKIIKANTIRLPQELLGDGERYLYDPKTEQLMIEKRSPQ
jgi:hypothetical protein